MKYRILITGSLIGNLTDANWNILETLVKAIIGNGYILINGCAGILREIISINAIKNAMDNDKDINCIVEYRQPLMPSISDPVRSRYKVDTLLDITEYYKTQIIDSSKPDIVLFIGGDGEAFRQYQYCQFKGISYLSIPQFKGTGEVIYAQMLHSNSQPSFIEKESYELLKDLGNAANYDPIKTVMEFIEVVLQPENEETFNQN